MPIIHLANTDFEFELAHANSPLKIQQAWEKYPICLQLQYLPLLYASEDESIAVTHLPNNQYPQRFILLDDERSWPGSQCLSWGASLRVQKWAKERGIIYNMPPWEVVQEVNSKLFSFMHSPSLPEAALISNEQDLKHWIHHTEGKRVLKTCFGLSGRGHFFIDGSHSLEKALSFCEREWHMHRPLIAEPWVNRFFDFSTQWEVISPNEIEFIGTTVFESDPKGVYQATLAGHETHLLGEYTPFLDEHKRVAQDLLSKVANMVFFGPVGVDAFLFRVSNNICLQPIVEVNARQTMSLAALRFQRKNFPEKTIRLAFTTNSQKPSLLPPYLMGNDGKKRSFNRFLTFEMIQG